MRYNSINSFEEHPLKSRVEKVNLRQYDLARFCECSQGFISQALSGVRPMPEDLEYRILQALRKFEKPKKIIKRKTKAKPKKKK